MRYALSVLGVAAALAVAGCEQPPSGHNQRQSPRESAKQVDADEPPLLLEDAPVGAVSGVPMADNSRCFVCHINYANEDIAVTHARQDMGCAYCHGESDEHIADESWSWGGNGTPPTIMYTRDKINPFCLGCHSGDKLSAVPHKSILEGSSEKYCTDCHGEHRLKSRRCKWK